jgi:transposase-like protein
MMRFPIQDLLNQEECYHYLLDILHPEGLACPNGHELPADQAPHDRQRTPIVKYRCRECGAVYNIFTDTLLSGTHYDSCTLVLMLRGFSKGASTQMIADELALDYGTVLKWRHLLQAQAMVPTEEETLSDEEVESDEMYQNAGEKGDEHDDPEDPPRQRANPRRGRGTYEHDRPVIVGTVGRESSHLHLAIAPDSRNETLAPLISQQVAEEATLFSDEAYHFQVGADEAEVDTHYALNHNENEFARDPDDDGFHQIHSNTIEGIWVGLRNFLRRFRGVHKKYLAQYVAMFEWAYNLKEVTDDFIRLLLSPDFTLLPS